MTSNQQRAAEVRAEMRDAGSAPAQIAAIAAALDAAEGRGRAEVAARLSDPDPHRLAQVIYEAGCISGVAWEDASIWAKGKAERQARAVLDVLDIAAEVAW
jgi:hypothetical protein